MRITYDEHRLKKDVAYYGLADGAFRGIMQTPVMLGIGIALMHLGESHDVALGEIFLYVIGLPRFSSLIMELAGGVLSIKLGRIGSFSALIPGFFLRGVAVLSYLTACVGHDRGTILAAGFCATLLSEMGRGIISGSVQDAYEQLANIVRPKTSEHLIAYLNNHNNMYIFLARMIVTILGVLALIIGQFLHNNILLIIVFLFAALPQFIASLRSIRFYKIAKERIGNSYNKVDTGDMKQQFLIYFKNKDWLWSLGFSFLSYNIAYTVTFSTLTFSGQLPSIKDATIAPLSIALITILALNSAFSSLVSSYLLKKYVNIKEFNEKIYSSLGIFVFSMSGFMTFLFAFFKPYSEVQTIIYVFLINALWTPLLIWGGWVRRKIIDAVRMNSSYIKNFGTTNVFYYSMISGMYELGIALTTSAFYVAKKFHQESLYIFFVYAIGIIFISKWMVGRPNINLSFLESKKRRWDDAT